MTVSTFNDFLRRVEERRVIDLIERRSLTQSQWRLWRRYQRTGDDRLLALLSVVLTTHEQMRAAIRLLNRTLADGMVKLSMPEAAEKVRRTLELPPADLSRARPSCHRSPLPRSG